MGKIVLRKDKKNRVLKRGESQRSDGKYQYKYFVNGQPKFLYSWKLEQTDGLPAGKRPCLSLRELEKQLGFYIDRNVAVFGGNLTVLELVEKYVATKTGVRQSTKTGYKTVINALRKEDFSGKKIDTIRTSDAKLFLIKLQQEGKGYSTIHTIRGVLRPAFQMAVDDDVIYKNPFGFELADVVVNDSVRREAVTAKEMRAFLTFTKEHNHYKKYYDGIYVLFHTGMRISEFCGLTKSDIDLENRVINIDHQLLRTSEGEYIITTTKTNAGTRKLPMTDDVHECFTRIISSRKKIKKEKKIEGHSGFLFLDKNGMPMVAMHWQKYFQHIVNAYNSVYKEPLPKITLHVCRHTYCSIMAKSGMNPKTLQYLMGHSEIGVTLDTYTHLTFEDAKDEVEQLEKKK